MKFRYRGTDQNGEPIEGETTAESPRQATAFLRNQQINVIELKAVEEGSKSFLREKIDTADIAGFCEQLANLTDSGKPLPRALEAVAEDVSNGELRHQLQELANGVREGRDLASMFEEKRNTFPPILSALVRAGQKIGNLTKTLRLAGSYLWDLNLVRERVKSIVAYPAMVFILTCVVGSLVILQVVPHFQNTFQQMDLSVPWTTRAVLYIGSHFHLIATGLLAAVLLAIFLFSYLNHPPEWVRLRRRILFKLPLFGRIFQSAFLCRFCRLASVLLKAGCNTDTTLELLAELEKERMTHAGGKEMAEAVRNGTSMSDAMRARMNVFPELLVWMVESCEQSGRLPEGFAEAADAYERETEREVEMINSTLPGVCVIVVGGFVGFSVTALFAPLISMLNHMS